MCSIAAVIVAIIGSIIDHAGEAFVGTMDTCINKYGYYTGDDQSMAHKDAALWCSHDQPDHDCSCTVNTEGGCYYFNLNKKPDQCSQVMNYYKLLLHNSGTVCNILVFITIIWSIWICAATCCHDSCTAGCPSGCCDISTQEVLASNVNNNYEASEPLIVTPGTVITNQPGYYAQTPTAPPSTHAQASYPGSSPYPPYPYTGYGQAPPSQPTVMYVNPSSNSATQAYNTNTYNTNPYPYYNQASAPATAAVVPGYTAVSTVDSNTITK